MNLHDWPSLNPQALLAERLFGEMGTRSLKRWLQEQFERIDDPGFARRFSDHIALPGVAQADFNHRLIRTRAGTILGGIRFRGGDITRPFVEIVSHTLADIKDLRDTVEQEWKDFSPSAMRIIAAPGYRPVSTAQLDMSIHAARYDQMQCPDGKVHLAPFERVEDAVIMVKKRYEDVAQTAPDLGRNLSPAAAADLADWHSRGELRAMMAHANEVSQRVGLLAVRRGGVEWIEGDEVAEEVVETAFTGHGFAAQAQMAWAAGQTANQDRLLIGTIDRLNLTSRRSAEKAGRPAVLEYVLVALRRSREQPAQGPQD
ncbi:hypothetical protein [Natronohydrobacter thiooxidans]|uniref:hypothetical protein n=1 Tax=Natronohydrobacter thiooxidans TaxID=87172 RepID=UPI0008FF342B|nr:hypothetical protein [Natronohydrobacter thiooxidans]